MEIKNVAMINMITLSTAEMGTVRVFQNLNRTETAILINKPTRETEKI